MSDHVRAGTASGAGADLATPGAGFARSHRSLGVDAHWLLGAAAAAALGLASNTAGAADSAAATATRGDLGGMEQLIAAAKEEGKLNVIALPPDWANWQDDRGLHAKYGIEVDSAQPDASSQDEINAANQLRGQERAPDVFDLGANVALRNTDLFARTRWRPGTTSPTRSRTRRPLGQRLRRLHVDRLRRRQRAGRDQRERICSSRSSAARSR